MEDARDRLEALGAPIPEPTADQIAASQALENSRQQYNLANRAKGLIVRGPDVVHAARVGDPSLADPSATYAPSVSKRIEKDFNAAVTGKPVAAAPVAAANAATATDADSTAAPSGTTAAAPAALSDIPAAGGDANSGATTTITTNPPGATPVSGSRGMGVEIITPSASSNTNVGNGLSAPGPANTALPPVEKAAEAPDAVNDVQGVKTPVGQTPPVADAKGKVKNPKPDFDNDVESSSTHKKKKGVKKLNPF